MADVDTTSETYRHQCEVRQLLLWRQDRGRTWVHEYINGGPKVRGIRQHRGDAAADRLLADCQAQWAAGNTGQPGEWMS